MTDTAAQTAEFPDAAAQASAGPATAPPEGAVPFEIGHLSDTHLGRKQYSVNSGSGRNQREADMSVAYKNVVESIVDADPPLIIHAGDMYDSSRPAFRHVMLGAAGLSRLAEDGRIVVMAAGNHDMPADAGEASPVDLHAADGVYLASRRYRVIDCSELVAAGKARPELDKVAVHLLPHDSLKSVAWDEVQPWEGYTNILVSHCVVGGSELYRRAIGREYSLPIDVVTRGWHYVALGHYHKQGPVAVGGYSEATTPAWYSGSTENNGFSDVRDNKTGGGRGWLSVRIDPYGTVPEVTPVDLPIRAMFRLPVIDAKGLDHAAITEKMVATAREADLDGAVVRQVVQNLHPDTWGLVDVAAARSAAKAALWYDPKPEFIEAAGAYTDIEVDGNPLGDLGSILEEVLFEQFEADPQYSHIEQLARDLLGDALGTPEVKSCCDDDAAGHDHPEPGGEAGAEHEGRSQVA